MDLTARLDRVVEEAIANNEIVGSATLVGRDGKLVYARAAGWFDREAKVPLRRDAIFRLASVTKPLVAATALAMIERNLIGLDNAVSDHLPYFRPKLADGRDATITIRQLLTHTSGLGYQFANPEITTGLQQTKLDDEANLRLVAEEPLQFEPGTVWLCGIGIDVLGAVIATIHGGRLADAVAHYVTEPLGLADTGFVVVDPARLAIPYADGNPPHVMGDPQTVANAIESVVFAPGRIFNPKAFQSGGAGAVGTADDMFRFLEAIRQRGEGVLLPQSVAAAGLNQVGDLRRDARDAGQGFGYFGAVVTDPILAKTGMSKGALSWSGVYGHSWALYPAEGLTFLSMTNTALEGCNGPYPGVLREAIYADD